MNNKYIYIEVDTNDGDIISVASLATDNDIMKFKSIYKKIGGCMEEWGDGDVCSRDPLIVYPELTKNDKDFINDYMPYDDYGFHSVNKIKIFNLVEEL